MESSVEASQTTGVSNPKPALAPKPRLAPKPFSLQTNTTIRSIHAPKSATATPRSGKAEAPAVPKPALPAAPLKPSTSVSATTKEQGKPTKETTSQPGQDASDRKSDGVLQTTLAKESAPLKKDDTKEDNQKTPADIATKLEQRDEKKKDETSADDVEKLEESGSDVANPAHQWGSTRKRLSMELTSRFESGGGPPPAPSNITKHTTSTKHDVIKAESMNPEQNQTTPELPDREVEEGSPKEDYVGGGSIKRRISQLFESRPEVTVKREEPEMINGSGGVKARIKNWAMETVSETKPQLVPRPRSKSNQTSAPPPAEKTPETPPAEPPASPSQVADLPLTFLPVKKPTEVGTSYVDNSLTGDGQPLVQSHTADHADETDSAGNAVKRDNSSKRRSVHFGVVEKDDGGPPVILGSESDSSEDEEKQGREDAEGDPSVLMPVYKRVGLFQKESVDKLEAEKHHLGFEKKRRAQETEEATHTLEELRRKEEEEEKEREREKQLERERLRDEENQRLERVRLEEKEREKERLRQEDLERKRKELERIRLEEEEKEKLREEEMERQRKELERMRLEEKEKERMRQEEMERQRKELERMRQEEEEKQKERMRQEEMERQRKELERMRHEEEEKQKERMRQEEMERQRKELERMRQEEEKQKERMRQEEMERQRKELERMRHEEEKQKERMRQEEMERQRKELERMMLEEGEKEERLRQEEMERRRNELVRIRMEEQERENERLKQKEMERHRKELERIMMEEEEREKERLEQEEMERHRKEWERVRWEEEHIEKKNIKEEEIERERQIHQLWRRQRQEEREMVNQKEEDIKQGERKSERVWVERERQRLREEEERVIHESDEHKIESKLREEEMNKEKQREEEWENHWVSKVEKLKEENREEEDLRLMGQSEKEEEEREKYTRLKEDQEMERRQKENQRQIEKVREDILISFDPDDVPSKSSFSHCSPLLEPPEANVEVVYEDFSIKKNLVEVEFDDFSVKPMKWATHPRDETSPVIQGEGADASSGEEEEEEEEVDVSAFKWEYKLREQMENSDTREPAPAPGREEEEGQLISFSTEVPSPSSTKEEPKKEEEEEEDAYDIKDDVSEEAEDDSCTNVEEKGTDVLIDSVPDEHNEASEQASETDSPNPESDQHLEISSEDFDTTDFHSEADIAPFPESSTPLLDSSAQKSKAHLSKRRSRTRPSRSLRAGLAQSESPDWRTSDSSEVSSKQRESDSEDEQPRHKIFSPHPTSQRVPIFPGLSPAALIAQIKRKTGGRGEETEEDNGGVEKEDGAAPSPSQLSSSPRTAAHLAGAARVLPPIAGTDDGATACPPWLQELKSKKRLSQYDSEP